MLQTQSQYDHHTVPDVSSQARQRAQKIETIFEGWPRETAHVGTGPRSIHSFLASKFLLQHPCSLLHDHLISRTTRKNILEHIGLSPCSTKSSSANPYSFQHSAQV